MKLLELIETSELEGFGLLTQGDIGVAILVKSVVRDHPVELQPPSYVVKITVGLKQLDTKIHLQLRFRV